jgi:hypothetical protein
MGEKTNHTIILILLCYSLSLARSFHVSLQTDITVQFTPIDGYTTYELSWKEYPAPWTMASAVKTQIVTTTDTTTDTQKVTAEGLQPGTTYCVRVTVMDSTSTNTKGTPGKEIVLDTEQVGCTPTDKKSCCTIL